MTVVSIHVRNSKRNQETVANRSFFARVDLLLWILIVASGVFGALLHQRADFGGADVFYADAAKYLLDHNSYGVEGHPETTPSV
jgi:hypothetical protein